LVYFLYADDLNDPSTEQTVKAIMSRCNPLFYPPTSTWINWLTPNYSPHSNECGVHCLSALLVQSLHPSPTATVLLSYMHGNLAQIGCTWVASSLLSSCISPDAITPFLQAGLTSVPHSMEFTPPRSPSFIPSRISFFS